MSETIRLRASWVVEYDAFLPHYGTDVPAAAALLDQGTDDPGSLMADADTVSFTVEPVA